jgi:GNAT superfamily N-acetyltransferase
VIADHVDEALRVEMLRAGHGAALESLFSEHGGCFCRWWAFEGDKNTWLLRCATAPQQNRDELAAAVASGAECGVVALRGEAIVGWLKLTRATALPKLYEQRPYRALPCFAGPRDAVWTVGCVLVDRAERRRGIARALLQHATEQLRAEGARALEALPRGAAGEQPDELVWMGPRELYAELGFVVVHDFAPYPVLRLDL